MCGLLKAALEGREADVTAMAICHSSDDHQCLFASFRRVVKSVDVHKSVTLTYDTPGTARQCSAVGTAVPAAVSTCARGDILAVVILNNLSSGVASPVTSWDPTMGSSSLPCTALHCTIWPIGLHFKYLYVMHFVHPFTFDVALQHAAIQLAIEYHSHVYTCAAC